MAVHDRSKTPTHKEMPAIEELPTPDEVAELYWWRWLAPELLQFLEQVEPIPALPEDLRERAAALQRRIRDGQSGPAPEESSSDSKPSPPHDKASP